MSYFESGRIDAYSTETWDLIASVEAQQSLPDRDRLEFVGFLPDGTTLLAVGGMLGAAEARCTGSRPRPSLRHTRRSTARTKARRRPRM